MPIPIPFHAARTSPEGVSASANLDFEAGADGWTVHGAGFTANVVPGRGGQVGELEGLATNVDHGVLTRCVDVAAWRGHAVRVEALLQLDGVLGTAALWARVDGPGGRIDGLDNMGAGALTGTTDWLSVSTPPLPVLADSERICFGALVSAGFGRVRLDDIELQSAEPETFRTAEVSDAAGERIRGLTRLWGTAWYFDPARDQLPRDAGALDRAIGSALAPDADLQAIATTMLDELRVPGWVGVRAEPPPGSVETGRILEVVPDPMLPCALPPRARVLVDLRAGAVLPPAWQTCLTPQSSTTPDSVGIAWKGFPSRIASKSVYSIDTPVVRTGVRMPAGSAAPRAVAFVVDRTTRPEQVALVQGIVDAGSAAVFGETVTGADSFYTVALTGELDAFVPKTAPRAALRPHASSDPVADARAWLLHGRVVEAIAAPQVVSAPRPAGDPAVRMAGVATAWVTLDWFSPYWGDVDVDWESTLVPALRDVGAATSAIEWRDGLSRFVNQAHDGHSFVYVPNVAISGSAPNLALRVVEDRIVVVRSEGTARAAGIVPGMEVLTIDEESAAVRLDRLAPVAGGFREAERRRQALQRALLGPADAPIRLGIRDVGELSAPRDQERAIDDLVQPDSGTRLPGGLLYLRVDAIDTDVLLTGLERVNGVIVDGREYPNRFAPAIFTAFADGPVWTQRFETFVRTGPDSGEVEIDEGWSKEPSPDAHNDIPVAFLSDSRAISAAELFLEMAREGHVGPIFGEPTAGVDGDATEVGLPDGTRVMFTGLRVENRDGTPFHGLGVQPDHVVHPTIAGIASGRDEPLEAAADWLRQQASAARETPGE